MKRQWTGSSLLSMQGGEPAVNRLSTGQKVQKGQPNGQPEGHGRASETGPRPAGSPPSSTACRTAATISPGESRWVPDGREKKGTRVSATEAAETHEAMP